jgi:DNA-3-methyladenine glycosylase I
MTETDITNALRDPGIIRNRRKVDSVTNNARVLMTHFGGNLDRFATFLWAAVDGKPVHHAFRSMGEVPARDAASDRLSAELPNRVTPASRTGAPSNQEAFTPGLITANAG